MYVDWTDAVLYPGDVVVLIYASDNDQDGIVDREELLFGSSDFTADTDQDGLSDYWEIRESWEVAPDTVAPHRSTASPTEADRDRDGLDDFEEWSLGTNASRRDTDGDGFPDGAELSAQVEQSPLAWDEPSAIAVCCQLESSGRAYLVSVTDEDDDVLQFVFHPRNATPATGQGWGVSHGGARWAGFFVPRPIYWESWVEASDELGQSVEAPCPWPGIDPPNVYGCPAHPDPGNFDGIGWAF